MCRSALLAVTFALVFAASCSKKDKDGGPSPSTGSAATGSAATGSAAGSGSATAGSDTGSAGSALTGSNTGSDTGSAAGSGSAGSAAGSGSATAEAETEFEKLSHEDKVKFMKTKVMPPMKAAFRKFDAKEFANFTCKTCHGKDPQKTKYEMPSSDLPKLDFDALKKGEDKEWVEFMSKVVNPEMAKILGEHVMTEAEPTGFGCLECHEQKKK